jgi:hypothetical protein
MQFFSNLLRNKSEEEKSNNSISILGKELSEKAKPVRKRFSNLVTALKKKESNPAEKAEIIHVHHESALLLCKDMLKVENIKNNKRGAAWEDVSTVMRVLYEITRYGYDLYLEDLKGVTSVALYDSNRWEMKELGLNLLLNILNIRPEDELALRLLESAINLNLFTEEVQDYTSPTFPERSLLTHLPNCDCTWNFPAQDSLKKQFPHENPPEIGAIKQFSGIPYTAKQKECLRWIEKMLDYTIEADLSKTNINQKDHFNRWLNILKNSFLYLVYPNISKPVPRLGDVTGFKEESPAIIHFLVIRWLIKCIKNASFRDCLFYNDDNYDLWMNILALSFTPCATFSAVWPEAASKCLDLYNEWVEGKYQIIGRSYSSHVSVCLGHTVRLFDYSKEFSRRNELCKFVIEILKNFSKDCKDIGVLIESSLTIARVLKQTSRDQSAETYRPMVEFLLYTMLEVYSKYPLPWHEFKTIFRRWSRTSDTIIEHWRSIMVTLTQDFKANKYASDSLENAWQNIMHILGNPLKFYSMVLNSWTKGLKDIIYIMIKPSQQAPSPNFMLNYFARTLFRLILRSKEIETRKVAYKTLLKILIYTRGDEKPHEFYILHLTRLIHKSLGENNALTEIAICALPKLLPYFPELHILLPNALSAAVAKNPKGVKLAISVMSLPNYYKDSKIYGINIGNPNFSYQDMHSYIGAILESSVNITSSAPAALWGVTVSIIEKLTNNIDSAEHLLASCILKALGSKRDEIVLVSLQCLNFLSSYLGQYTNEIMTILIKGLESSMNNNRERVILECMQTIIYWLLVNNSKPCSTENLSKLFKSLQGMSITLQDNPMIQTSIEILCSTFAFYYLNFPLRNETSSISQSIINDAEIYADGKVSHFALSESAIITVVNSAQASKFILRTSIGKFYWESEDYHTIEGKSLRPVQVSREILLIDSKHELIHSEPPELLKDEPLIPLLLDYIRDTYTERPPRLFEVDPKISNEIKNFEYIEKEFSGKVEFRPNFGSLSKSRSLLSNMNLLEVSASSLGKLKLLEAGERLDRSLKLLDGTISRERIKIGVIYVASGQKDQREILENQNASSLFQEFIKKLGTVIDVTSYEGYIGGLEPGGSSGKQTVAYCDWANEVAFHIVPLMPTDPNDEQQVLKKRHVGNDIVQIVWSENSRDYLQDTITSQFNIVHIIIYPLPYKLFRIQIFKKFDDELGPLQDGMIIPWTTLATLVRVTAINANQLYRKSQKHKYEKPMFIRKKLISDIISRHGGDNKLHITLADLF